MDKKIVAEGKTTNEAIEKGLQQLKATKEMVEIKVLEEEKKKFYSILAPRVVRVEITLKEKQEKRNKENKENIEEKKEAAREIEEFLNKFLKGEQQKYIKIEEDGINVNIQGKNVNHLIGYRGECINSLQTVLTAIANKKATTKIKVFVDIEGYREKRKKTLEDLAERIARTVMRTKKPVMLEPMSAYERKIIHTKLQSHNNVETISKGEEPYRKVVIRLK